MWNKKAKNEKGEMEDEGLECRACNDVRNKNMNGIDGHVPVPGVIRFSRFPNCWQALKWLLETFSLHA
jgi:hypothetical protein